MGVWGTVRAPAGGGGGDGEVWAKLSMPLCAKVARCAGGPVNRPKLPRFVALIVPLDGRGAQLVPRGIAHAGGEHL